MAMGIALVAGRLAVAPHATAQTAILRSVAVTGDAPPNGDGRFRSQAIWYLGGISEQGKAVFTASLIGTSNGSANDQGIFVGDGSSLREIVRLGDPLPDGPGTVGRFEVSSRVRLNAVGQITYLITASSAGGGGYRLYRSPAEPGAPTLIVREGSDSPTGKGYIRSRHDAPDLADSGRVVFLGSVFDTPDRTDGSGIFAWDGGDISTVVAPYQRDVSGTYRVEVSPFGTPPYGLSVNHAGQVAFFAQLSRSPNQLSESALVMVREGTNVVVVARENQPVPDGAGSYDAMKTASPINEAGDVVFVSTVTGTLGQYDGLYLARNGTVSEVARSGFGAPDARWRFQRFSGIDINDRAQIAFVATDWDDASGGIFRGDGTREGLVRVVAEKQTAPDGNGTLELGFNATVPMQMNNAGQVLFQSSLRGTALGNSDDFGLFLYDDRLGLLTVARQGAPFLGSRFNELALADGFLNDRGDVAFLFTLFDGRMGVAIWSYSAMADNKPPVGPSYQGAVSQGNVLTLSSTNLLQGVSDPDGGAVFLNPIPARTLRGGSLSYSTFTRVYTYIPPTGFVGVDEFSYVIRDDAGVSTTFTGQIQVSGPNRPPASTGLTVVAREGQTVNVPFSSILASVTDPDGDALTMGSLPARTAGSVNILSDTDKLQMVPNPSLASDFVDIPVLDGRGGSVPVRVTIPLPDSLHGIRAENGAVVVLLSGSVGTWTLQRAVSLRGPWVSLGSVALARTPSSPGTPGFSRGCPSGTVCRGTGEFRDPNPPHGAAFYRMIR